jgi:hypothetical protein
MTFNVSIQYEFGDAKSRLHAHKGYRYKVQRYTRSDA